MVYVHEINAVAQLAPYRLVWDNLLLKTPGASLFHTCEWLEDYWRHFGRGQQLRVLIVRSHGNPVGILPLCVRSERTRVGRQRVLTYPLHDWGTYYGPIGPHPAATLLAGLRHIRGTRRTWESLDLRWVDAAGSDCGRTPRAMQQVGFRCWDAPWARTTVVSFRDSWSEYLASRSQKWRENRRRQWRALAGRHNIRHIRYRPQGTTFGDGDPRWDLFNQCTEIAGRSWQSRSTSGTTLCDASVHGFLKDVHRTAAHRGALDLNLLLVDDRAVAFSYGYHWSGSLVGLRMGFDPAWAEFGCGNILLTQMIRDSFQRGDRRLDLGAGSGAWKDSFATHAETCYRYVFFSGRSLRAQLIRLKRRWPRVRDSLRGFPRPSPLAAPRPPGPA